jgi:hypothetical protein
MAQQITPADGLQPPLISVVGHKRIMTDKRKGWVLIGIGLIGYLIVWVLIRHRFSLMYGIPAIPLIWGRILLTTESWERQARPVSKVIGIILVALFIGITVIGTIIEIIHFTR